jgi:hypothetical protein
MTARELKQIRQAIAIMATDCNVMQARCAQFETMLHKLQIGLEDMTPLQPLDVDKLPVQQDEELEMERDVSVCLPAKT